MEDILSIFLYSKKCSHLLCAVLNAIETIFDNVETVKLPGINAA